MIIHNKQRQLPDEWTDDLCHELITHAIDLGYNGNPSGYLLSVALHPFIGYTEDGQNFLNPHEEWNYDGIRAWIAEYQSRVERVWQLQVRPNYW